MISKSLGAGQLSKLPGPIRVNYAICTRLITSYTLTFFTSKVSIRKEVFTLALHIYHKITPPSNSRLEDEHAQNRVMLRIYLDLLERTIAFFEKIKTLSFSNIPCMTPRRLPWKPSNAIGFSTKSMKDHGFQHWTWTQETHRTKTWCLSWYPSNPCIFIIESTCFF